MAFTCFKIASCFPVAHPVKSREVAKRTAMSVIMVICFIRYILWGRFVIWIMGSNLESKYSMTVMTCHMKVDYFLNRHLVL